MAGQALETFALPAKPAQQHYAFRAIPLIRNRLSFLFAAEKPAAFYWAKFFGNFFDNLLLFYYTMTALSAWYKLPWFRLPQRGEKTGTKIKV